MTMESLTEREREDKEYSRNEKKVHYVHYTEGISHKQEEKKKIAQEEIVKEAIAAVQEFVYTVVNQTSVQSIVILTLPPFLIQEYSSYLSSFPFTPL